MRRASTREVQHQLRAILDRVEHGEEVAVTRRGRVVAHIVPAPAERRRKVSWPDFEERLARRFPDGPPAGPGPSEIIHRDRQERF